MAVLFGVSAGVRAVQLSAPERASYLAWQAARTQAVDYGGLAAAGGGGAGGRRLEPLKWRSWRYPAACWMQA